MAPYNLQALTYLVSVTESKQISTLPAMLAESFLCILALGTFLALKAEEEGLEPALDWG